MGWEADFLLFIQENIRSDLLTPFMTVFTHSGDYGIFMIVLSAGLLIMPRTRKIGMIAGISIALESLLNNVLIKNIVARTRPYDDVDGLVNLIERQPDYSFPSGHTGSAFAVMGAILVIALLGLPVIKKSGEISHSKMSLTYKLVSVLAMMYAVILAFSRLYVGVHYPTDVIGGIILGMLTSFIAYLIFIAGFKFFAKKKESISSSNKT